MKKNFFFKYQASKSSIIFKQIQNKILASCIRPYWIRGRSGACCGPFKLAIFPPHPPLPHTDWAGALLLIDREVKTAVLNTIPFLSPSADLAEGPRWALCLLLTAGRQRQHHIPKLPGHMLGGAVGQVCPVTQVPNLHTRPASKTEGMQSH